MHGVVLPRLFSPATLPRLLSRGRSAPRYRPKLWLPALRRDLDIDPVSTVWNEPERPPQRTWTGHEHVLLCIAAKAVAETAFREDVYRSFRIRFQLAAQATNVDPEVID